MPGSEKMIFGLVDNEDNLWECHALDKLFDISGKTVLGENTGTERLKTGVTASPSPSKAHEITPTF